MQILPTNATELLKAPAISTMLLDDERTNDFMDLINDILEDEDNEERSEDSQSQQVDTEALRAAPQVQSPYARNSHNGITFTLDEVCFTKQELQELRNDLIKAGATQESLSRLTALAELPDGATLAQVMASVKGTGATPLLSDDDKSGISSLLNQIDPSGVLNTTLQDLMQQGQGREALNTLLDFVGQLDATDQLDISRGQLIALGRGLGLDTTGLQALADTFGQNDSRTFLNGQFAELLAPASDFFARQQAGQESLDKALKETLQKRISAARARTEKERQANELQSRSAMQSKVHIDRTVQQHTRDILEDTLAKAQDDAQQTAAEGRGKSMAEQATAEVNNTQFANQQQPQQPAEAVFNMQARTSDGRQGEHGGNSGKDTLNDAGQNNKNASGWSDLLNKVEVKPTATITAEGQVNFAGQQAQQLAGQNTRSAAETTPLARQAVQDVTQAMLSSLKDGGKRMDLQLTSQELGNLTVTLTVRNGEVSALLRSEKTESAALLQQQLDVIRVNLEEQGLKVDKVEVQLQSQDEQNQLWQDLDQHNFQQEQQARREEFARMRNLATMRHSSSNRGSGALEHSMHTLEGTAHYAVGALNLVA